MKKLSLALLFTALLCFNAKSQDFIKTSGEGFRDVAVTSDGKMWGCGTNGTVWYSYNGTNWTQTEASGVKSIGASNDNVIICGENETVWVGDRNGARFQQTTAIGFQDVAISLSGKIVGAGTNETVWTSSIQSPNSWSRTEASGFISVDNNDNNIVAAGSNGKIWIANINGTGWIETSASGFQQVSVAPSGVIYAVGTNGTLWSSYVSNKGQNWEQIAITDVKAVDLNNSKVVVVKNDGTIWKLEAAGVNIVDGFNNLSKTIATVYTDCGFAGQSYKLQVPLTANFINEFTFNPKELGIADNSISSIKLSKGYSATLYFANGGGSADIIVDEDCLDLYKLTNISSIRVFKDARLKGYADMHTHPMSHLGFGKRLMHGVPDLGSLIPAGTRYKGFNLFEKECNTSDERATTIEQALGTCNATHGGWGAENDCGNYIRAIVISKAFDGDFVHNVSHDPFNGGNVHGDHRHEGIETSPSFMYWPHQTSVTHQQMWWEWLKRTYDGGLRVMVALTVNSELFAEVIDGDGPKDDKASADLQLDEIISFVGRHDDFMEIARTPADLRRIVGANKMAVLLGMEVDNIGNFHKPNVTCNESTVRTEIQRLYNKGVRYIFPIHLTDNKFGGAAVYEDLFNYVNRYSTGSLFSVEGSADATINFRLGNGLDGAGNLGIKAALDRASGIPFPPAFDFFKCPVPTLGCWDKFKFVQGLLAPDPRYATYTRITQGHVNRTGLTSLGEFAIQEMMKLGMVIDVDHMSAKAINRSLSIAESVNGGYPINMGHNGIRIGAGDERSASIEMVKRVSALGGMFGVGTADTNPSDFVKNYNVAWYVMGSRNTAIGTDVNGFEPLPKASPNLNSNDFYRGLEKCKTGNRTWDYTKEGVAHYGLMTEFLRDARLQQNGYEMMNSLMLSAEYFAQMWEKCERQKTQVR